MKKLTAGIFSVLMGLVSVNAAEAAVASKGYVDAKIGNTDGKTVVEMINSVSTDLAAYETETDKAIEDAIATAGANADSKISNLNLAALSRIPVECQSEDSFCVLTAKDGMFYWEAIERADDEEQPQGTLIPAVETVVAQ